MRYNARNHDYGTDHKTNHADITRQPKPWQHNRQGFRPPGLAPICWQTRTPGMIAANGEKEYGWIGSIIDLVLTLTAAS